MRRCFVYSLMLLAFAGGRAWAQAPTPPAAESPIGAAGGENAHVRRQLAAPLRNQFDAVRRAPHEAEELKADVVTPEMWLYMQELRRYNDPLQAVRSNAATRAAHRRSRLAAMQWFGFSNTRPQASPVPFMDMYSPTWVSNSWNPYGWIGSGNAWTAVRVEPIVISR